MIDQGRKNLLGVSISAVDYEYAVSRIIEDARMHRHCATTALAVHGVITGVLDRAHRHRLNTFDLVTPDGQPVRWALNLLHGTHLKDRVYGPTMTLMVCAEAARHRIPVYFYGSKERIVRQLCDNLERRFPGLRIVGAEPSRFRQLTEVEQGELVNKIKASGAEILFVGLGCPRQEVFTYEMSKHLEMPVLSVGAAFDYHSGVLAEPPAWLQRVGLQWLFRLCQDPARLWRRYVFTNTRFVALLLGQWLQLWRPSLQDTEVPAADVRFG